MFTTGSTHWTGSWVASSGSLNGPRFY